MTGSRETRRPHAADGCSRHSRIFSLTPPAQRREASARCPLYEVTARAGALTDSHIFAQPEGSNEGTGGSNAGIGAGRPAPATGIGAGRPAPATEIGRPSQAQAAPAGPTGGPPPPPPPPRG